MNFFGEKKFPQMDKKKLTYIVLLAILTTSCADTWSSVKRGLTGTKAKSTDEFLVEKKDPLILPPDYDDLPSPAEKAVINKEVLSLEKKISELSSSEETSASSSTEESILKKIRKQ